MYRDWDDYEDDDFDDWDDRREQWQEQWQARELRRQAIDNFFTNLTIFTLILFFFGASSLGLWQVGRWAYGSIF